MTVWPAIFVFSAITAIRSFQGGPSVAVFTGALHSLLFTSVLTLGADTGFSPDTEYWIRLIRLAASSFIWPVTTLFALEFAVAGTNRWVRLACALFVASLIETYLTIGIFTG